MTWDRETVQLLMVVAVMVVSVYVGYVWGHIAGVRHATKRWLHVLRIEHQRIMQVFALTARPLNGDAHGEDGVRH